MAKHRRPPGKKQRPAVEDDADASKEARLNKYIARAGVCSRRKADELISAGRVSINGAVVTELGTRVSPGDRVEVGGRLISQPDRMYLLLNKPKDTITTTDDERGRQTVLDLVRLPDEEKQGLFPVGRLDRDTTGVLLLTNDGDLAHRLMHPSYEISKRYRVRTKNAVKPHELDQLRKGIQLDDGEARADEVAYFALPDYHELALEIHEGRNRQVRRMMEALGHEIAELERIYYAGLDTSGIRRGRWRRLSEGEVRKLRKTVQLI